MNALLIEYAPVSTYEQGFTAQRIPLERLGVLLSNTHTDQGLTGTNRFAPSTRRALAGTHS